MKKFFKEYLYRIKNSNYTSFYFVMNLLICICFGGNKNITDIKTYLIICLFSTFLIWFVFLIVHLNKRINE